MKHKHQMSLIARRAQIRRTAASQKNIASVRPDGRPALRLVSSNHEAERAAGTDRRDLVPAVE